LTVSSIARKSARAFVLQYVVYYFDAFERPFLPRVACFGGVVLLPSDPLSEEESADGIGAMFWASVVACARASASSNRYP
jgi:hypothetical protein